MRQPVEGLGTRQRAQFRFLVGRVGQCRQGRFGVAGDDARSEAADAAARLEAVAASESDHAVGQWSGRAGAGVAEIAEYVAGPHRCQLIRIAEHDQPSAIGQRTDQAIHQGQIHHGTFVDDHRVHGQRRTPVQQPMNGDGIWRKALQRRRVGGELVKLLGDGFLQPSRGLAGGRRQRDAARIGQAALQEQRDKAYDQRRFAGAGAAGDDGESARRRQLGGAAGLIRIWEQAPQRSLETKRCGIRDGQVAQALGQAALGKPKAA